MTSPTPTRPADHDSDRRDGAIHRTLVAAATAVLLAAVAALTGPAGPVRAVQALGVPVGAPGTATPDTPPGDGDAPVDGDTETVTAGVDGAPEGAEDVALPAPVPERTPAEEPPAAAAEIEPWSVEVHSGLGAWADVWDWTMWGSDGDPTFTVETIDALAAQGVRTIYVQTTRIDKPDAVMEEDRLRMLIDRAHDHGMFVVGWYLPTFVDVEDDLRRIEAAMALPIDGFALDIESQEVLDTDVRTERLLRMSQRLREVAGDRVLVANVLPPVQMEELAPSLWPDFPWAELGEYYEVFMPMGYFTFREPGHHWRDAEAYTAENVRRIRERVGDPHVPVHFIGGIADLTTVEDVQGMTRGAQATGAIGLSLYDVATTRPELWTPMQEWRDLR